ncbi:MAG: TonB-dependent receptor, partial [Bacteroidota bacterium]
EFTKGLESWFTLGVMQTKEKISYTDITGAEVQSQWLRRPTDRRVNFSAVFQDQLKNNPSVRVNLSLVIGTSIPYYFDGIFRYQTKPNVITPYRRIDLGLSKTFSADKNRWVKSARLSEAWISLDIFNVLDINNVISYSWIKDLDNNRYGVPDYLTGRRLNLRLHARF